MKLNEYKLKTNELYYVGTNTGFICITTGDVLAEHLKYWDGIYTATAKRHLRERLSMLERLMCQCKNVGKSSSTILTEIQRDVDELNSFVPFGKREIEDSYTKLRGGTALLLEGGEVGRFWMKFEYDKYWQEKDLYYYDHRGRRKKK